MAFSRHKRKRDESEKLAVSVALDASLMTTTTSQAIFTSPSSQTTDLSRSAPQTSSQKSKLKEIEALESGLESLTITTNEPDWSQFRSLQPAPFFAEFLRESPVVTNPYVHDGTIFHPFPRLPTELRLEIWELARPGPQIVRLKRKKNGKGVYSNTPIPGILHACKESRSLGLEKWYAANQAPVRKPWQTPLTFYFDVKNDFMFKGCEGCASVFFCKFCSTSWPTWITQKVQRVILQGKKGFDGTCRWMPFSPLCYNSPDLKEVILLNPECSSGRASNTLLCLEDLVQSNWRFLWQKRFSLLNRVGKSIAISLRDNPGLVVDDFATVEKASCMELAITAHTSKLYGFLQTRFKNMNTRRILGSQIPGHRPPGMSYTIWRRRNSNDQTRSRMKKRKDECNKPIEQVWDEEEFQWRFKKRLKRSWGPPKVSRSTFKNCLTCKKVIWTKWFLK